MGTKLKHMFLLFCQSIEGIDESKNTLDLLKKIIRNQKTEKKNEEEKITISMNQAIPTEPVENLSASSFEVGYDPIGGENDEKY